MLMLDRTLEVTFLNYNFDLVPYAKTEGHIFIWFEAKIELTKME